MSVFVISNSESYTLPVGQVLFWRLAKSYASISCSPDFWVPNKVELTWLLPDALEAESLLDCSKIDVLYNKFSAHIVSECIDSIGDAGEDISSLVSMLHDTLGDGVRSTGKMRFFTGSVLGGVGLLFSVSARCSLGSSTDRWV